MCGLAGFINGIGTRGKQEELLKKMVAVMNHRGPDDRGYYQDEQVYLGSCRLSIIDLEKGHQPMANENETIWLIYNGEIYNFKELREDLSKKRHFFKTNCDTEVIIHAYEEYGYECLQRFKGMFAFALWDKNKGELFLARDRLGIKPLYYTYINNSLIFASEIKAILQVENIKREVDAEALDQYLTFLWVPDPKTIFKGIYKLSPGHYLVYKDKSLRIKEYWDLRFTENEFSEKEWIERILGKFEEIMKRHLISDVPLGVFLSGGIDSSTILAFMSKILKQNSLAFTTAFRKEDLRHIQSEDDLKYARLVAGIFHAEQTEIVLAPDIVGLLQKVVYYMDEPVADIASVTTYLISQAAGGKSKVLLSGMGGDELFAGYSWDLGAKLLEAYQRFPNAINGLICTLLNILPDKIEHFSVRQIKKLVNVANSGDGIFGFKTFFTRAQKENLYTKNLQEQVKGFNPYQKHNEYINRLQDKDLLTQMLYLDIKTFLPCSNLAYTDKMSMANSIEARVPFLDHEFVELAAGLPSKLKIKGFQQKYIYKKALRNLLPKEVIRRKKAGFGAPVWAWLKDLQPLIKELLSEGAVRKRGYFNYDFVRQLQDGDGYNWMNIWQLLTLELWQRTFIDG